MTQLRIGVVGLERRWRKRYQPALHALRERFVLEAVCDAVYQKALHEARRLGCKAASGVIDLLERSEIDAVLLIDATWHGLWPLEAACRFGKPVFCAIPLEEDEEHAESVSRLVSDSGLPVMAALGPRSAPATVRLQDLLRGQLGAPHLLLCEQAGPKPGRIGSALLDWCAFLFDTAPLSIRKGGMEGAAFDELLADFGLGRTAQICRWWGQHVQPVVRLRVVAERGMASVVLPRRLRWTDAGGQHSHTSAGRRPLTEGLLERFHQAVLTGQPMQPSLGDACRALGWLRAESEKRGLSP